MPVPAAAYSFNGNGEMTGCARVEESDFLGEPVLLTNTHSVGVVRDAVVEWGTRKFPETENFSLPVVANDGQLNDINGSSCANRREQLILGGLAIFDRSSTMSLKKTVRFSWLLRPMRPCCRIN